MRNYDQEVQDFNSTDKKYKFDFDLEIRKFMMRAFRPFFSGVKALEMGSYDGYMTDLILVDFHDVTIIEASSQMAESVRERFGSRVLVINETFENSDFSGEFDTIFLIHTLEHLDDPVAVLKSVNRWLKVGGRLFVAVPNANAPSRQIAVKMGLISHNTAVTPAEQQHGHRVSYTLDTLEREVSQAGLSILHRGGILFKALSNHQFDLAVKEGIISREYLEGAYQLGTLYPDFCASIYLVCGKGADQC